MYGAHDNLGFAFDTPWEGTRLDAPPVVQLLEL